MIHTKTILIDQGYAQTVADIMALNGARTEVGLPEGGKTSGRFDMQTLIDVAAANEFGSEDGKHPPERSFIRSSTDENRPILFQYAERGVNQIIAGAQTARGLLASLGSHLELMIKAKMQGGPFAPLHRTTVARKGHDMPLVETGQLFETIQHKEVLGGVGA